MSKKVNKKATAKKAAPTKAAKPAVKKAAAKKPAAKKVEKKKVAATPAKKVVAKKAPKKAVAKAAPKKAVAKAAPKKAVAKVVAKKGVATKKAKTPVKGSAKVVAKKTVTKVGAKSAAKPASKIVTKPTAAKVSAAPKKANSSAVKPTSPKPMAPAASVSKKPVVKSVPVKKSTEPGDKTRYSDAELQEFKEIILEKMEAAKKELNILSATLSNPNDNGTDDTAGTFKVLEDGSATLEKEHISQMAARQRKFIDNLEAALVRIENKTYGICKVTGKLIAKERLRAVPHTTLSMEAKLKQG